MLTSLANYFTLWNVILIAASKYTHTYVDLMLTSTVVLVVSTYLLFVSPGHFRILKSDLRMSGSEEVDENREKDVLYAEGYLGLSIHVVLHVLPFAYVLLVYAPFYLAHGPWTSRMVVSLLLLLGYMTAIRFEEVYDSTMEPVAILSVVAVLGYLGSFWYKIER